MQAGRLLEHRGEHGVSAAVILMAYGSPDRLADVPAYYADIRGGRPIAPDKLEDLIARYRRRGIERDNPLNAMTEQTRAALERELGLPVFTGMRHWQPRIAEAVERAVAARVDRPGSRLMVEKDFPCAHPHTAEAKEPETERFAPTAAFLARKRDSAGADNADGVAKVHGPSTRRASARHVSADRPWR